MAMRLRCEVVWAMVGSRGIGGKILIVFSYCFDLNNRIYHYFLNVYSSCCPSQQGEIGGFRRSVFTVITVNTAVAPVLSLRDNT